MKQRLIILFIFLLACLTLGGCGDTSYGLSSENPAYLTIWHCYDSTAAAQFDALVAEFNATVGMERGVCVTAKAMGSQESLEAALWDSIGEKPGSLSMPDIFYCNLDLAAALETETKIGLVDFDDYVTEDERLTYVRRFLDAGCVGAEGAWKLFPTAETTQVLMLNKTDWEPFADATGAQTDDLLTWEGLLQTAEAYYEWSGGKAFFGLDDPADFFIIGSSQLGSELFRVSESGVTLGADETVMRKLWNTLCLPYINGRYAQTGRYRSDDLRTGEIIAMVCSASRAAYFPDRVVTVDGCSYSIECMVLPLPNFEGTASYAALSGGGMAVTQSDAATEYAGVLFLEWLTQTQQSMSFSAQSGYLPVTLESVKSDVMSAYLDSVSADSVLRDALLTSLSENEKYIMYTPTGFAGGTQAKAVLESAVPKAADPKRAGGADDADGADGIDTKTDAGTADLDEDALFEEWYAELLAKLQDACR